jgi:hypothetical protein
VSERIIPPVSDPPVCDFCCSDPPVYGYPADDFLLSVNYSYSGGELVDQQPVQSVGGWAACRACSRLIESNNRRELARRIHSHRPPDPRIVLTLETTRQWVENFMAARGGPRMPFEASGWRGPRWELS